MPFREPGRVVVPLAMLAILLAVAYATAYPRIAHLPVWQQILLGVGLVVALPLSSLVVAGALGLVVGLPFEMADRLQRRRFRRFAELLDGDGGPGSVEEARRAAARILEAREGRFSPELRDAPAVLQAASRAGPLQKECVAVLLRHGRDGGEQARALYQGREVLGAGELEEWARWFSMWEKPGEGQEEDLRPRAYAHALARAEGPIRRRILNRLLTEAQPTAPWREVARSLEDELRGLDAGELAPLEREGLGILLGGPAAPPSRGR